MHKFICCIDGNIGAGKSTLLEELQKRGYYVFQEDLGDWGKYLELFYANQSRWAFTLQISILKSMVLAYRQILETPADIVFTERSPLSSLVFSRNSNRLGYLNNMELNLVEEFYEAFAWSPSLNIFLDVDTPTCFKRMKQRGRECEQQLDISYLDYLQKEYLKLNCTNVDGGGTTSKIADDIEAKLLSMNIIEEVSPPSR